MQDMICPFSAALARETCGCVHARAVVRRGGAEYACDASGAHAQCLQLIGHLKAAALPAFGVADDPLEMPHSVLQKIQLGGLQGLQRLLADATGSAGKADIAALVGKAVARFATLEAIPVAAIVPDITGYRLTRRRGR